MDLKTAKVLVTGGSSGIGYATPGVKAIPLAAKAGKTAAATQYSEATYENCLSGDYPMARFLSIYINKKPNQPLDKLTGEFLKFVVSREGQEIVVKDGYFPVTPEIAAELAAASK